MQALVLSKQFEISHDGLLQTDLTVFPYHFTQAEAHGWTYNILMTRAFICWIDFHQTCTDTY